MKRKLKRSLLDTAGWLLLALLLLPGRVPATLLVHENFHYSPVSPATSVDLAGQNGGAGWAGPWAAVSGTTTVTVPNSGAIAYSAMPGAGFSATESSTASQSNVRPWSGSGLFLHGCEIWFSFQVKTSSASSDLRFYVLSASDPVGGGAGAYISGAAIRAAIGSQTSSASLSVTPGATMLLVGRIQCSDINNADAVTVWLNPPISGAPPASGSVTVTGNLANTASPLVGFRGGWGWGGQFDEIRIGTTFADVVASGTVPAAEWSHQDVGATGAAGSFSVSNGVYTVRGAGTFAWTDDRCHFASVPLSGTGTGNGSITARLLTQQNTHYTAVAGVAIREDLAPDSSQVSLYREQGGVVRFRIHKKPDNWGSTFSTPSSVPLPVWLKLERAGKAVIGSYSTDGVNWTTLGWTVGISNITMPAYAPMGLYVSSRTNGVLNESTFDNVTTTGTDTLMGGWLSQDLGSAGLTGAGYMDVVPFPVFAVEGAGTGFGGAADSGQFVYRPLTGNVQIVARMTVQEGGASPTAQGGLMVRENLTAGSKNALLALSPDQTLRFQSRASAGGSTAAGATISGVQLPYWLKLVRNGTMLAGYYSQDGWNWAPVGSATVSMASTVYVGLATSSKNTGQLHVAEYDNVATAPLGSLPPSSTPVMTDITAGLSLVEEIDTAATAPVYESAPGVSQVTPILDRPARVMPTTDAAATMAYVIGQNKGLVAGNAYVLTVEYPDDVSRAMYIVNRGADYTRGLATGKAIGDARNQYVEPSAESLDYPHTLQWQTHKQYFHLLDRFQGVAGLRQPAPGYRPYLPSQGFHVVISRMKKVNDARNEGAAVGKIRLYAVNDPSALYAPVHYPPPHLPRRSIFWREEMADGLLQSTGNPNDFAVADPLTWYVHKMKMAKVLGINTFAKDLLEFGYNQGWETYDQTWTMEAQPPARDLWTRMVPKATEEGFELFPYLEYKGSIGVYSNQGLARQRRAHKLYHEVHQVCGGSDTYTNTWYECITWTEGTNADLTDPDTLVDAKRTLDRIVGDFRHQARFKGIWLRTRGSHLPISFAQAAIDRFKAENPGNPTAQTASVANLRASYWDEANNVAGNRALYDLYINWWFGKRAAFLTALRDYLRNDLGVAGAEVLFTPTTNEAVPPVHHIGAPFGHAGIITDEPGWFTNYYQTLPEGGTKYKWQPTPYSQIASQDLYRLALEDRQPIYHSHNPRHVEAFHSAPGADPLRYSALDGIMMSFPTGRLFTLDNPALVNEYRCATGLTVMRHYPLNEDNGNEPSPFSGQLGYLSVDCDRAGHHMMLAQARAIAVADPSDIGYLSASSFSTGYPEIMRRFNQAFLAVPAVASTKLTGAGVSSDPEVVVRQMNPASTAGYGTYYYVVNTSMHKKTGVTVNLPSAGPVLNLVTKQAEPGTALTLTLDSAELRAYRVGP